LYHPNSVDNFVLGKIDNCRINHEKFIQRNYLNVKTLKIENIMELQSFIKVCRAHTLFGYSNFLQRILILYTGTMTIH